MSLTLMKRTIFVEEAPPKNATGKGRGTETGNTKGITGTEIMTEIGITGTMEEAGKEIETEIEAVKEIERGIGNETVTASEMTTTTEIETGMAGKGNAGTETVAGTGAAQGAEAGIGVKETVKWESSVRGVAVVVPVLLEGVPRMVRGRSLRRERKRKRRRAAGTVQILMIQRL